MMYPLRNNYRLHSIVNYSLLTASLLPDDLWIGCGRIQPRKPDSWDIEVVGN